MDGISMTEDKLELIAKNETTLKPTLKQME